MYKNFLQSSVQVILFYQICICSHQKSKRSLSGVRNVLVNFGETTVINFTGFGENLHNKKCVIKDIVILAFERPQNEQFNPVYVKSNRGRSIEGRFQDRASITCNTSLIFTIRQTNRDDENLYCPKATCSGANDVVDCLKDIVSLTVVEPVKHIIHHTSGPTTIRLGDTVHAKCSADGDPPPQMKIVNVNSGEVISQGQGKELSYTFQAKRRESNVTIKCEAQNNPNVDPVSKALEFDVQFPPSFEREIASKIGAKEGQTLELRAVGSPIPHVTIATADGDVLKEGRGLVTMNITRSGNFTFTADNGVSPRAVHYTLVGLRKHKGGRSTQNTPSAGPLLVVSLALNGIVLAAALLIALVRWSRTYFNPNSSEVPV